MTKITMLDTIESIPKLIEKKFNNLDEIKFVINQLNKEKKVKVIASGTSYNSAFTVKTFSESYLSIPFEVIYPNYFIENFTESEFESDAIYIYISQGGKTKSVMDAIDIIHKCGGRTLSLTERGDSIIGQHSTFNLEIGSEKEPFIYRTSGYTLTTLTLYLFLIEFATNLSHISFIQRDSLMDDLNKLPQEIDSIIEFSKKQYHLFRTDLIKSKALFFAGGSSLWAVAQEADIKFMEMVPLITNSFEIEELIHGPQNCFKKEIGFFFLANNLNDSKKAQQIDYFVRQEIGSFSKIISCFEGENTIKIGNKSHFDTLLYATMFQIFSYELSQDHGRDLNQRIYPQIDHYITKSL
ncbi:SIS domain-containing protein [Enterococcus sp. LJL90]